MNVFFIIPSARYIPIRWSDQGIEISGIHSGGICPRIELSKHKTVMFCLIEGGGGDKKVYGWKKNLGEEYYTDGLLINFSIVSV